MDREVKFRIAKSGFGLRAFADPVTESDPPGGKRKEKRGREGRGTKLRFSSRVSPPSLEKPPTPVFILSCCVRGTILGRKGGDSFRSLPHFQLALLIFRLLHASFSDSLRPPTVFGGKKSGKGESRHLPTYLPVSRGEEEEPPVREVKCVITSFSLLPPHFPLAVHTYMLR